MVESKNNKHHKLIEVHKNNIEISDKNFGNKFLEFENATLNKSKLLLKETEYIEKNYKKYKRGSIIKVDFGVNVGSEFSGIHYAIVLTKNDSCYSSVLQVLPLTSKRHKNTLELDNVIYSEKEIQKLKQRIICERDYYKRKEIKTIIDYYNRIKNLKSFACIDHIKTISKLNIMNLLNKYDYLDKLKCSNEIMSEIDFSIIKEYTKYFNKNRIPNENAQIFNKNTKIT